MKNIIVYGLTDRRGGIESFFLNYANYLKKINLDFIKVTPNKLSYEKGFENSKIYYVPMRRDNASLRRLKIREVFRKKNYDALWFNSNDLASVDIIKEAKRAGISLTTNQACCGCKTFDGIYNWYLFYYLLAMRPLLIDQGSGGAQPNISKTKIEKFPFALPPFEEQKRIVTKIEKLMPLLVE